MLTFPPGATLQNFLRQAQFLFHCAPLKPRPKTDPAQDCTHASDHAFLSLTNMSASLRPHLDSATRNPPAKREPSAAGRPREPLIPFKLLDAPSQRLYLSAFYLGLTAWRLYDYFRLLSEETDSLWLFMKWGAVDGIFLFSLPELQVPWLSWSLSTTTVIFLAHAVGNAVLMFRIPVCSTVVGRPALNGVETERDHRSPTRAGSLP